MGIEIDRRDSGTGFTLGNRCALCTYVGLYGGTVYMDDRRARKVAERHGLKVRGTAGLMADACCRGGWTVSAASLFLDDLLYAGLRLPFDRGGFEGWASKQGLFR